jgi:hypothetical protein
MFRADIEFAIEVDLGEVVAPLRDKDESGR